MTNYTHANVDKMFNVDESLSSWMQIWVCILDFEETKMSGDGTKKKLRESQTFFFYGWILKAAGKNRHLSNKFIFSAHYLKGK